MEILIVALLIAFQSIFGIGLLIFGTPIFLLIDYSFVETLNILLPISITISFLQFFLSEKKNFNFIKEFNYFTLPFLTISLSIILLIHNKINFEIIVATIILLSSFLSLKKHRFSFFKKITKLKKILILIAIGFIHGTTNMGGTLLSIYSTTINNEKSDIRSCISYGYLIMGIIQLSVLFVFEYSKLSINKFYYILLIIPIYFPMQKVFFKFENYKYSKILNIFALIYSLIIYLKYFS